MRRVLSRAVSALGVAAVTASAMVVPAVVAAGPAAAAVECREVVFLGARGSGQPQSGSDADAYTGFGPQVWSAYGQFHDGLAGRRSMMAIPTVFPSRDAALAVTAPELYFTGLEIGVDATLQTLIARARDCPEERIVLAGYSQGAMVMHRVLEALEERGTTRAQILGRVDGAVLIADGDRVPRDTTNFYGTAPQDSRGIGVLYRKISGASGKKLSRATGLKTHSVCNISDAVCDAPGTGYTVHTGYTGTAAVFQAADAVTRSVMSVALARPRVAGVAGQVGQVLRQQLQASVDPAYSLEWRVAAGSVLPPGIAMSAGGLLTGTPSAAGEWTSELQVRGVILGVGATWSPATVRFSISSAPTPPPADFTTWAVRGTFDDGGVVTGWVTFSPVSTPAAWDVAVSGGDIGTFSAFRYASSLPEHSSGVNLTQSVDSDLYFLIAPQWARELRITIADGAIASGQTTVSVRAAAPLSDGRDFAPVECFSCVPYRKWTGTLTRTQ